MDVLQKLRHKLPNMPKKLAQTARYALDNPHYIALNSMRATALEAGVTSTTMLRLARHIGFDSYEDFRVAFQSRFVPVGFGSRAGALRQRHSKDITLSLSQQILQSAEQNIHQLSLELVQKDMSDVARHLRHAPVCYLVGSGSLYWLALMMKNTGGMILPNLRMVGSEYSVAAEAMSNITKDDMVIGFGVNPYAQRTINALSFAKEQSAIAVAITDRPSSPIALASDFAFYAKTTSLHYYPSMIPLMAIIEVILATVVAEGDGTEILRIQKFERVRKEHVDYIEY